MASIARRTTAARIGGNWAERARTIGESLGRRDYVLIGDALRAAAGADGAWQAAARAFAAGIALLPSPTGVETAAICAPFVPAPVYELTYRDGGPSGADVLRRVVASLPDHLASDGVAQIVTHVAEREGENYLERIRRWLVGANMNMHALRVGEDVIARDPWWLRRRV